MKTVNITIDGKRMAVPAHFTILQAAQSAGIYIPTLCHHPALPPMGGCRLCVVEVEKERIPLPSCATPVAEGMVIHTQTPLVEQVRRFALELILSIHPLDCMKCEAAGACELQDLAYQLGARERVYAGRMPTNNLRDDNPFIAVDMAKCIRCRRCVRACDYVNGVEAVGVFGRGFETHIGFGPDSTMLDSPCEFCGACVSVCPTAALWPKQAIGQGRTWHLEKVRTTCVYCAVGCQIELNVDPKRNRVVYVTPVWDAPVNHGWTCVKGKFGHDFIHHPDRLTKPLVRTWLLEPGGRKPRGDGAEKGEFVEVDWDTALNLVAERMTALKRKHGNNALAVIASSRCTNEENYLTQKLARQIWGTHNVDNCARL
jgi:predicted molibdopterin-dependent oxidoreductase YjgC